jgi:hypothetical protein
MGVTTMQAPRGSYRFLMPDTYGKQISIEGPGALNLVPTDELKQWMSDHAITCSLVANWITNDLHFDLDAVLSFESNDDAIIFKLTWADL